MATIKKLKPKNTQSDSNVQIEELTDRDHVRRRPGMYLDNIDYCVYEILDNSIDEHMAGYGDTIYIQIDQDGWIRVQDEGRGIPIEKSKKQPTKTQFEVALSSLKAGKYSCPFIQ